MGWLPTHRNEGTEKTKERSVTLPDCARFSFRCTIALYVLCCRLLSESDCN